MAQKKITDLDLRSNFDATCNLPVDDTTQTYRATGQQIRDYLQALFINSAQSIMNLSLSASVATNALTIAVKTQANANASSTDPILIGFRSATLTSGLYNMRTLSGALSMVVSSGSTLGTVSAIAAELFVYAIDNAGTIELGVCNGLLDESVLQSSTAEGGAGAADSAGVLYSTTARSNVPVRLIGKITVTEATAGTWATSPSAVVSGRIFDFRRSKGSIDGSDAAAGEIGEYISSRVTTATNAASTTTYLALTSISLTPGDWDVSAIACMSPNGAGTIANAIAGISTTSASGTGLVFGDNAGECDWTSGSANAATISIPSYRVKITATTTHYLNVRVDRGSGTPQWTGRISARRVR